MTEGKETYEAPKTPGRRFLEALVKGESIEDSAKIAIIVAHQDDWEIGFGGQFPRFPECLVVHVTDGAPADPKEWKDKGFESREAYAAVRTREATDALNIAGHKGERDALGIADQEAALHLVENTRKLVELFKKNGTRLVMTHAYEGGHPDHDASAFAVHAAKLLLAKEGIELSIIEAPYYRPIDGVSTGQKFVPAATETFTLPLTPEQQELKQKLFAAHVSQQAAFTKMSTTTEWLREAPSYDFTALPNEGNLSRLYTAAGVKDRWQELTKTALAELGLG